MTPLRIWAPKAQRVEVVVDGERRATTPAGDGVWLGPALANGQRYLISLDGGEPRPDPRSRSQPDGVHGASEWIDLEPRPVRFHQQPLASAVIYELHVGTFSEAGTFDGAIEHLDKLVELGVTHVELLPVAQFSGRHGWGYDGVGLFAAHAAYGGPAGLTKLIDACHARELAVLIDVVHNHFGPEGAYWPGFAPYTTSKHKTPWGEAINLDDTGSAEVRRYMLDSALGWLRDYGADGLRLDALHSLVDRSGRHFVRQLVDEVRDLERSLDRKLVLIGEYDDHDRRAVTEREHGGWGLDAHWNDDFHHAVHALLTGERENYYQDFIGDGVLGKVLEQGYALDGGYSPFRQREHGAPYGDLPRDRLVGYIQSHDQVGNRALGERLHHLAGIDRARIAAAMLLVSPFVPMLFQGEEWAASTPFWYFAEVESEELRAAIRKGRGEEHGWSVTPPDPTAPSTREGSTLRWAERQDGEHGAMLGWYRALIELRKARPELRRSGPRDTRVARAGNQITIERGGLALICNLDAETALPADLGRVVLASRPLANTRELPPASCAIVARE